MLKRFFISMLGTMAGIWISTGLVIFGGLFLIGAAIGKSSADSAVRIEKKSILYFDLSGEVIEREQEQSFMQLIQNFGSETLTLEDMLLSLREAADDDRIEGLYLRCGGSLMGPASRQELIQEINNFKLSGKWVVSYADIYTQGDYLTATTADSLFLNPMGSVDIHGLGGTTMFFKGALDKLGVKMQILKVGTFKSAVEPFMLSSMSDPARLQIEQYLDSIWTYMATTIADNRNIPVDSIYAWAPQVIGTRRSDFAVSSGLVSAARYERQVNDRLRDLSGLDRDDDLRLVTPSDYMADHGNFNYDQGKDHVAVYYAAGDIVDTGDEGIVGPTVVKDIISLADDDNVKGLVLRVNSGGGSAFASEQIWEALEYFKEQGKPYYVSMGDYAASGGYYISCGADRIFADSNTITGSIGVFGMIPDLSGLVTDKLGITFSTVQTNPNAAGIGVLQPMTPAQLAAMQKSVEDIYDTFTRRVADGRDMSQDSVKAIAEGRVWIGSRALQLGLVDQIANLDRTTALLLDKLGMQSKQVVRYPLNEEDKWQKLIMEYAGVNDIKLLKDTDRETLETLYTIRRLRDLNPMQARMENIKVE